MFGFGRSSKEKSVINLFALQLQSIGLSESEAVANATKVVDEVLRDIKPHGIDPFKSTQGDEYVSRESFIAPRLLAGLSADDIRSYWNRPLLVVLCEMKMRELINFVIVDIARQQGKDTSAASTTYKRTFPRYGDPSRWDPNEKFNADLKEVDADLYAEFANRVDTWRQKKSDAEVAQLIDSHGTLNAAIRNALSQGDL